RLRHAAEDMEEVGVVSPPQFDQVGPAGGLVVLEADPLLLLVAGKVLSGGDLAAHEALVVVRGRVDQVAEDFLAGPPLGGGPLFALRLGEAGQDARQLADGEAQTFDGVRRRGHSSPPCFSCSSPSRGRRPSQWRTGWGGYFGYAGSVLDN